MAIVKTLILASTSPFRQKLLASTGLSYTACKPQVDEKTIVAASGRLLALKRGLSKALAVAEKGEDILVIGADQTLSLGERLLDKVPDASAARNCLQDLAGQTHYLHSATCLVYQGKAAAQPQILWEDCQDIPMPMRPLGEDDVEAYVQTGEWQGSVGCYKIEHRGIHLFALEQLPDYSAIVGLPLPPLLAALRLLGIDGLKAPCPPWTLNLEGFRLRSPASKQ